MSADYICLKRYSRLKIMFIMALDKKNTEIFQWQRMCKIPCGVFDPYQLANMAS